MSLSQKTPISRLSPSTVVIIASLTSSTIFAILLISPPENTAELYTKLLVAVVAFPFLTHAYFIAIYATCSEVYRPKHKLPIVGMAIFELIIYILMLTFKVAMDIVPFALLAIILIRVIRSALLAYGWADIERQNGSPPYHFIYDLIMFLWSLYGIWTFRKRADIIRAVQKESTDRAARHTD